MDFSDFSLAKELQAAARRMGFERPTPIQATAIPPGMEGRDVLASAETGSGKTAAFLLPIMHKLLPMQRGATRALVVAPTRELAAQIAEHFRELAAGTRLTCAAVHGGVAMGAQERAFRKGVDMIVACPGRLLDHMRNSYVDLSSIQFLVIDEADRMLDMGFLPDIKRVLAAVPKDRQTFFFSATLPQPIVHLSRELLKNPAKLNVDRKPAPATGITHSVFPVPSDRKSNLFLELLGKGITGSVLVFTRTKHRANRLADFLDHNGVRCARIHGNRSQSQRTAALSGFKAGQVPGPGGDGYRGARHRRGSPGFGRELRRSPPTRRLHPQGRPHGTGTAQRRRPDPGLSGGGEGFRRDRARARTPPAPAESGRVRLHLEADARAEERSAAETCHRAGSPFTRPAEVPWPAEAGVLPPALIQL